MEHMLLASAPPNTFDQLLGTITYFFDRLYLRFDAPMIVGSNAFGVTNYVTFGGLLEQILPPAFVILGVLLGVRLALKLFKRFSR